MATTVVVDDEEQLPIPQNPEGRFPNIQPNGSHQAETSRGSAQLESTSSSEQKSTTTHKQELPDPPNGPLRVDTRQPSSPTVRFAAPNFVTSSDHAQSSPATPTLNSINTRPKQRKPSFGFTPTERRRSVQLAQGKNEESEPSSATAQAPGEAEDGGEERPFKERQGSFLNRLKALATPTTPGHTRSPSSVSAIGTPGANISPNTERTDPLNHMSAESGTPIEAIEETEGTEEGAEADEEGSEDNAVGGDIRPRKRRKSKRPSLGGHESLPSTPKTSRFASFMKEHPIPGSSNRPIGPLRRATMSDVPGHSRAGVSEDEGKDKLRNAWRKGIEGARGLGSAARKNFEVEKPEGRRPSNLRRLTGFGGVDGSSSPLRQRADRYNNASAQRWRQVKAGLRMLGQRKKEERMRVDHQRSAQLMAELLAGAPAALIFASMFQRDEHHHRKVPVLLEQLKITIPEGHARTDRRGDRDYVFKVDLEYGNGPARMQWTVFRSVNDFVNLHVKYKAQSATEKVKNLGAEDKSKSKIPRFPKSVIPYARGMRGLFEKVQDEEDEQDIATEATIVEGTTITGPDRPKGPKRVKSSFGPPRRVSTADIGNTSADPDTLTARQRLLYAERSRQKLEIYLQQMIHWLIFRPDSTRLCKFLELSAMAIRLSAENGYQGKQGLLQIASRKHRELNRKTLESIGPKAFKERHKRRWFLVRHSYVLCVDGPECLNPYDVFLVDSEFAIEKRRKRILEQNSAHEMAKTVSENATPTKKAHLIRLYNSERKLKLYARNEKQYVQFQESLGHMMQNTVWSQKQRFASFAPVRNNVWARWLVDGRDHMWQVSRAIDNAKDFIYIHNWWLSPELYMRRPAAISQKWRLDRLLQRKAQEGVKIFVIVYRNIESAIPIDSEYTKWSLLDLHENICIQRSPNQFRQNQFFWAHHEKLVVVDNMMAFVGGIDLCFGRWDDPGHSLVDDKLTGFELDHAVPRDSEHCQVWPGKDYSNPRVQDFYALDRPYEEMYDRTKVPRMPWHDISMQIVGQPARDIGRHFVQRWNYILRSRVPSRPTPVLIPPPEYDQAELDRLGMTGTCQIQILRSCASWSIGTPNRVEHSIMNAYYALIKESEHFVYIENQFYISSCTVEGTTIHNKIGDAIVERATQAHENGERWQACLIIPLMPGFQNSVDSQDGTSIRLIMQCQFRSICRGDTSIFGRLRARGIEPENYVRFYSLRQWGKIGPRKCLITEQLYIHAKCMIVDDRTAIIGSANINERSMLGSRDSEVAAIVTDTRMLPSFMGGEPYDVGEFPHTLRKRLMREHLGVDVDAIYRREQAQSEREQDAEMTRIYGHESFVPSQEYFETPPVTPPANPTREYLDVPSRPPAGLNGESNGWAGTTQNGSLEDVQQQQEQHEKHGKGPEHDLDVDGYGFDNMKRLLDAGDDGLRDSFVDSNNRETLAKKHAPDVQRVQTSDLQQTPQSSEMREKNLSPPNRPLWSPERVDPTELGLPSRSQLPELPALDDTDIGGPQLTRGLSHSSNTKVHSLLQSLRRPEVHEDCMTDPIVDGFYQDIWHQVAENNTKLYRQVFRCMPDSEVLDWKAYEKFNDYNERFMQSQGIGTARPRPANDAPPSSGPPGSGGAELSAAVGENVGHAISNQRSKLSALRDRLNSSGKASVGAASQTEEIREKEPLPQQQNGSPESPGSGASSVPTAVPSPDQRPLDEKEAAKYDDPPDEKFAVAQKEEQPLPPPNNNRQRPAQYSEAVHLSPEMASTQANTHHGSLSQSASQKRRRRTTLKNSVRPPPEELLGRDEAEDLLKRVQGNLVLWPYDWYVTLVWIFDESFAICDENANF